MKDYSNYHNVSINDKIAHDGKLIFEYGLDGFEGYTVQMDNTDKKVLIYNSFSDKEGTSKYIIGQIGDIERGKTVTWNNDEWLIINKPDDNKIYRKAVIKLCNSKFPLPGSTVCNVVGQNDFGEDIEECTTGNPIEIPCIAETFFYKTGEDQAINLPEGQIKVTMPYTEHEVIALDKEFNMYDSTFKITGIDYTQSLNKIGLLIINAKRV